MSAFDQPDHNPVYGAFIGAHHVDELLIQIIQLWNEKYLQEMARRSGEGVTELTPFRSYRVTAELERMPEDQTPSLILVNRGLYEKPEKRAYHRPGQCYKATWNYQVGCLVSARGTKQTGMMRAIRLAKMYVGAMRILLIQKRERDDGLSNMGMIDWVDENYDGVESDGDRTICLAYAEMNVEMYEVATWGTGPKDPTPDLDPDQEIPILSTVTMVIPEIIKVPTGTTIPEFIEGGV